MMKGKKEISEREVLDERERAWEDKRTREIEGEVETKTAMTRGILRAPRCRYTFSI